jgi:hypothetical protein
MRKRLFFIISFLVIVAATLTLVGTLAWLNGGPSCSLRIDRLDIDGTGQGILVSNITLGSRCALYGSRKIDGVGYKVLSAYNDKSIPWSHRFISEFEFTLDPESDIAKGMDLATRKNQAIRLVEGETYEITPDKPLVLYSFKTSSGHLYEARLEVSRELESDLMIRRVEE